MNEDHGLPALAVALVVDAMAVKGSEVACSAKSEAAKDRAGKSQHVGKYILFAQNVSF
jgi:hypothetical protein